jgi:Bacterial Ig domain
MSRLPRIDDVANTLDQQAIANGWPSNSVTFNFLTNQGHQAMAIVTITITDPGIQMLDDSVSTPANTPITISVLANDVDNLTGNNSNLIVASVTQPPASQGSVAISADQKSVIFTPAAGFIGQAQFDYTAARQ